MDAVELTLRHNPDLKIAELTVESRAGVVQERRGQFDRELSFNASLEYRLESLTQRERQAEIDQRQNLQTLVDDLAGRIADRRDLLDELIAVQQDPENRQIGDPDAQTQLDLINELIRNAPDPGTREEFEALRDGWLQRRRNEVQDSIETLQDTDATERERLRKLGEVPDVNLSYFSSFDAAWRVPYRNGSVATWFADLTHNGANFKGKPNDASLGGKGIIDLYKSRVGVRLDVPLGQGSGREVVTALERAAEYDWQAEKHRLAHQAAAAVRRTADSYWALVAAQMRHDVLRESARRQDRLVELADILIRADLLPRAEIARAHARQADARAILADAEDGLRSAQLALADSIGLELAEPSAFPRVADAFPAIAQRQQLSDPPIEQWVERARSARQDRQAAARGVSASRVLERSAEAELRSRHDLQLELFASGLQESSSVRRGIDGAFTGKWVFPSARASYSYSRPLNNDLAKGRLRQASAGSRQSQIGARELDRRIHNRVLAEALRLADVAEQAEYAERALALYAQAIDDEREKLELGSATVIDLILTEERLTQAALGVVAARRAYASSLLALRFETAWLLDLDEEGYHLEASAFLSPPSFGEQP